MATVYNAAYNGTKIDLINEYGLQVINMDDDPILETPNDLPATDTVENINEANVIHTIAQINTASLSIGSPKNDNSNILGSVQQSSTSANVIIQPRKRGRPTNVFTFYT